MDSQSFQVFVPGLLIGAFALCAVLVFIYIRKTKSVNGPIVYDEAYKQFAATHGFAYSKAKHDDVYEQCRAFPTPFFGLRKWKNLNDLSNFVVGSVADNPCVLYKLQSFWRSPFIESYEALFYRYDVSLRVAEVRLSEPSAVLTTNAEAVLLIRDDGRVVVQAPGKADVTIGQVPADIVEGVRIRNMHMMVRRDALGLYAVQRSVIWRQADALRAHVHTLELLYATANALLPMLQKTPVG